MKYLAGYRSQHWKLRHAMLQFVRLAAAKELGCLTYSERSDEFVKRILERVRGSG